VSYPNPIIFGAKDKRKPFPQLNLVTQGGKQYVFSRTNYNLFLTPEEAKFLSFGDLLEASSRGAPPWDSSLSASSELIFSPRICYQCAEQPLGCPLVVKNIETAGLVIDGEMFEVLWWLLKDDTESDDWSFECPFFQALLDLTETKAEWRFMKLYLDSVLADLLFGTSSQLFDEYEFISRTTPDLKDRVRDCLRSGFIEEWSQRNLPNIKDDGTIP